MSLSPATLTLLKNFPGQLATVFQLIPPDYLNWRPASWEGVPGEAFTAIEQICHVRDIEIDGYHVRITRMLKEADPSLESLDGYSLAKQRRYESATASRVLAEISSARSKTLELLRSLTDQQFDRRGSFEGYGNITLRALIHFLCSHDQQHLACLQWLLGKIHAERARAFASQSA